MESILKKQGIGILKGLIFIVALVSVIRLFHLGFWGIFIFLSAIQLLFSIYKWIKTKKRPEIKHIIKNLLILFVILYLYKLLFKYLTGFWGFIAGSLIISGVIIFRRRKKWLEVKHTIERKIWGKPIKDIPKDYWKR